MPKLTPLQLLRKTIDINYRNRLEQFDLILFAEESRKNRERSTSALQKILNDIDKLKLPEKEVEIETFHLQDVGISGPKGYITTKRIDSRHALKVFVQKYIAYINGRTELEFVTDGKVFDDGLNPGKWIQYHATL